MRVNERELPDQPIESLVAADDHPAAGIAEGEIVAYRCERCGAADETLMQIIHEPDCELAGKHGRSLYAHPSGDGRDKLVELEADHRIDIVKANFTDRGDVYNGEPLLFRCGECGNADETLIEIRHDEDCDLSGRFEEAPKRAVADGRR